MKIQDMAVTDIHPYSGNPRSISDEAIGAVAHSLKEFGFQQPLVVDGKHTIIVGHTRLLAAAKLGMGKVPVVVADSLTPEQVKAYRLADNKTGELSSWDFARLETELDGIDTIDMEDFGFQVADFAADTSLDDYEEPEELEEVVYECPHCHMSIPKSELKKAGGD